jgi:hypothetical protein
VLKGSAIVLSLLGAFALGVWAGPSLTNRRVLGGTIEPAPVVTLPPKAAAPDPPPVAPAPPAPARGARRVITPEIRKRLKPLLNAGTDMEKASAGFRDAELFAAVAHAAKNTGAPFVVLKDHVLKGRSLRDAIHAAAPKVNATREASRALAAARSDIR